MCPWQHFLNMVWLILTMHFAVMGYIYSSHFSKYMLCWKYLPSKSNYWRIPSLHSKQVKKGKTKVMRVYAARWATPPSISDWLVFTPDGLVPGFQHWPSKGARLLAASWRRNAASDTPPIRQLVYSTFGTFILFFCQILLNVIVKQLVNN